MTTFVLVPGAWLGGWCWRHVAPLMCAAGHAVYTPTLTGLGERAHLATPDVGLDTHVRDIVNVLVFQDLTDVVLVGHSYAGFVVTAVAQEVPERLARLVYLDTAVPRDGQSQFDPNGPTLREVVMPAARADGDGWRWPIPPAHVLNGFASMAGIDDETLAWWYARSAPHPIKALVEPVRLRSKRAEALPRGYIYCSAERASERADATMARTSPAWRFRELPTGHWPMFSMPAELAEALLAMV